MGADPANKTLHKRYDDVLTEWVTPDPQKVPQEIFDRKVAVNPRRFLDSPIIPLLLKQRGRGRGAMSDLREAVTALTP